MKFFIKLTLLACSFFCLQNTHAQNDSVMQRIFLVGDAGELDNEKIAVCDWLKQHVNWNDSRNTLIYLGDNIYPEGMPAADSKLFADSKKIMDYQLSVVLGKEAKAFFVPGNHDWKKGKPGGLAQINNEGNYIESLQIPNVKLIPANGCPGPEEIFINDKMLLIFMDSQWWLQSEKTGVGSDCDNKSEDDVIDALKDIISVNPDKLIILAMHHPLYTHGKHGGYFTLKQHIFPLTEINPNLYIPLPVIGSIYPISRSWFGNIQDTKNPQYKNFIDKIEDVIKGRSNIIQVAGHEHNLQLLQKDSVAYVVSGSGSKTSQVRMGKYSSFAMEQKGFAIVEQMSNGENVIKFYTTESNDLSAAVFTSELPALPVLDKTIITALPNFPDSITISASTKFKSNGFRNLLLGSNYRKEWGTPIRVKVFDMGKEQGGLTATKRGGGHQTKSLRLKATNGKEYVLRKIEKNVTDAALPPDLKGVAVVKDLVADGVSASYPYAALSVPDLAEAAGVPHTNPKLVYVPDDERLGRFRSDFGNSFCLFEERDPGEDEKTASTLKVEKKLQNDNDNAVDQKAFLQARLLDMFIMDFDRHEDQWKWGSIDNGKGKTYYPIPRDRDQPFFMNAGILPYFASRPWVAPQLQGFRAKAKNINTYNFNARNIDRNFLNELTESDWRIASDNFIALMTDELIEKALQKQPPEIQPVCVGSIFDKLKERRKYFTAEMMEYYKFLSKTVTVIGSDKRELFDVLRNADGSLTVTVSKISKDGDLKQKIYERKFVSSETNEVRLFGLSGDDKFVLHGKDKGQIKLRIIGGEGNDLFDNSTLTASGKTKIYDLSTEKNEFTGNGKFRSRLSSNTTVNELNNPEITELNKRGYKYNVFAPSLSIAFNPDDGIFLGVAAKYTQQGFRKEPFKIQHKLAATHSLATSAYNFRYGFEAIDVIGKADLLFNSSIKAPNNTINFFTYGNESVYDKSNGKNISFYRTRFNLIDADLLLRANIGSKFAVSAGPAYQYFSFDSLENMNRFINQTNINGLNPVSLNQSKSFAGLRIIAGVDTRNNIVLPSRGINWQTSFTAYKGLNTFSNNFSQLSSELSFFLSFNKKANFVIANRTGGGISFGQYEFYQAQYLSGTENLRGYRKYRFAGEKMLYNNLEMRLKITEIRTYLFPASLGLLAFYDIGRVWVDNDKSNKWHQGFGGGIWLSPIKKFVITAAYGYSDEGGIPVVSFGFQF